MGSQVAWQMAFHGKHVTVYDPIPAGLDNGKEFHRKYAALFTGERGATSEQVDATLARLTYTTDLPTAVRDADLISESVPESIGIKEAFWRDASSTPLRTPCSRRTPRRTGPNQRPRIAALDPTDTVLLANEFHDRYGRHYRSHPASSAEAQSSSSPPGSPTARSTSHPSKRSTASASTTDPPCQKHERSQASTRPSSAAATPPAKRQYTSQSSQSR